MYISISLSLSLYIYIYIYMYMCVYIYIYIYTYIYIYIWEVLLGIRLLGTTFGRGLSKHQAATARMPLVGVESHAVDCRPLLGALSTHCYY